MPPISATTRLIQIWPGWVFCGELVDVEPHFLRAGESDEAGLRVGDERVADRAAGAGHEVDDAGTETRLAQHGHEHSRDRGRIARGLEHDRVARHDRRGRHAGHDREREVPGRNHDPDAERDVREAILFARQRNERRRVGVPECFAGIKFEEVDRFGRVGVGLAPGLTDFENQDRIEVVAAAADDRRRLEQKCRALRSRDAFPRFEGFGRRLDRFGRLLEGCGTDRGHELARPRRII